jgi:hypothetical protein
MASAALLILAGIIAIPVLLMLALIGAAGFQVIEPVYQMTTSSETTVVTNANPDTIMLMTALSMIGLSIVLILWWWLNPLRSDVRQGVR